MVGTAPGQDFYFLAPGLYTSDIHTRTDKDTHTLKDDLIELDKVIEKQTIIGHVLGLENGECVLSLPVSCMPGSWRLCQSFTWVLTYECF